MERGTFTLSKRSELAAVKNTPGPDRYNFSKSPARVNATSLVRGTFTLSKRSPLAQIKNTPGPNRYNPSCIYDRRSTSAKSVNRGTFTTSQRSPLA